MSSVSTVLAVFAVAAAPAIAHADEDSPTTEPAAAAAAEDGPVAPDPANEVHFGVGLRLRNVRIPKFAFGLFLDNAPGGASDLGYGVDVTRRKGDSELQLGLEFDRITPTEGVYINSGDNVALGDEADYLLDPKHAPKNDKLGWFTVEFTYLKHIPITKQIAFRYGGGLGLGILTGKVWHYDVPCNGATNDTPEPGCKPVALGGTAVAARGPVEYNLPPVFPVINAIIGLQFRPIDAMTVNLEIGIRTLPFAGVSASYFF